MSLIRQLRRLSPPSGPVAGQVVAVTADRITVATPKGPIHATRADATAYKIGDRVQLQDGRIIGVMRSSPTVYVV